MYRGTRVGGTGRTICLVCACRTPQIRTRRAGLIKTSVAGDGLNAIRTRTVARFGGRICHRSTRFDHLTVQIIPGIGHRRANRVGRVRRCRAARVGGTHGAMVLVGAWFDDLTVQIIPSIGH